MAARGRFAPNSDGQMHGHAELVTHCLDKHHTTASPQVQASDSISLLTVLPAPAESLQSPPEITKYWLGSGIDLAESPVVVKAGEAGDVLCRDGGCVLLKDERIGIGRICHHQHLHRSMQVSRQAP